MSRYCSYLGRFPIFGKTQRLSITVEPNEINFHTLQSVKKNSISDLAEKRLL